MKARSRNALGTLVLLAAAAAALAVAYFAVARRDAVEEKKKEAEERVFAFAAKDVKSLVLDAKGATTSVAREGGGWKVTAPLETAAENSTVDALVDGVAALRRRSLLDPAGTAGAALEGYGLAKPRARLTLTLASGAKETLALGDENPFDGTAFARPTSGAVLVVPGDVRWTLEKSTFDLREKRLLPFEDEKVSRLEVKTPKLAYALVREGGRWKLAAPVADRGDDATSARVANAVRSLRATEFVAAPASERAYGLDRPAVVVKVVGTDGAVRTLRLGTPPGKDPERQYARLDGSREVAGVSKGALADVEVELSALRNKTLLAFDRDAVTAVRLASAGGSVEVQKKPAQGSAPPEWVMTAPRAAPVEAGRVSGVLSALSSLAGTRIVDEGGKDAEKYGLGRGARKITLLGEGAKELGTLSVGRQEGGKVYARSSTSPRILEVEASALATIPWKADELERKPAPAPEASAGPGKG